MQQTTTHTALRYMAIGIAMFILVCLFAYTAGCFTPDRLTQTRYIAALQEVGGTHLGFRSNHAKGVCVSGSFESGGAASVLSKADLFKKGRTPIVGRFALAGGMPFQMDALATVRSMALEFQAPGGQEWRTGMNNIPVFIANSAQGFYEQTLASKIDPLTGKPDAMVMSAFLARHPETARALALVQAQTPSPGFADSTYNSLNAFLFVNAAATVVPVRWAAVPMQGNVDIPADSPALIDKNHLFDELIRQVNLGPLKWRFVITVGEPGDPTNDATLPWSPERQKIDAGILTIDAISSEDAGACTDINFDPLVLPPGIVPSDDPILSARSAVYARSFTLRAAEKGSKPPSAVSRDEIQVGSK